MTELALTPSPPWVAPARLLSFAVSGELDIATVDDLELELTADWITWAEEVVLDLRRLEFVDCAGLHALERIQAHHRSQGTSFRLAHVPAQALGLLRLTGRAASFAIGHDPG